MYRLLETIRVEDGEALHLDYHQKRIDKSTKGLFIQDVIKKQVLPNKGCFKLRCVYTVNGVEEITITPYIKHKISTFRIVNDNLITYSYKYENRSPINRLFQLRNGCDDIIIVKNGFVTDSSFANIVLHDGEKWITPNTPLLEGTCRDRLIHDGAITEEPIGKSKLYSCHRLVLINAMLSFDENSYVAINSKSILDEI